MIKRLLALFNDSAQHFDGQEPGETVFLLLRRHRFTIMYPISFILLLALVPIVIWLGFAEQIAKSAFSPLFSFLSSLWYLLLWASLFYRLTLHNLNTVVVTDRRIIENEQYGFFNRKVSELHTYRVQDVTVHTHGVLETLMGFGDISVQTAASDKEFVFHRIADPEKVKDKIMQVVAAHQSKVRVT